MNQLLGRLPGPAYARIRPRLALCEYEAGVTLVEETRKTRYVHFPVTGVIARMIRDASGKGNEVGICGNEGAIGLSGLSGGGPIPALSTSLVLVRTVCYRAEAPAIDGDLENSEVRSMIIRYFRYVLSEAMLTAFCNKHHSLEQQLCRVLLLITDRAFTRNIRTTHQIMGEILGTRREGITEIVGRLRERKVLSLHRGALSILDHGALLKHSCDCYQRAQERYRSLIVRPLVRL